MKKTSVKVAIVNLIVTHNRYPILNRKFLAWLQNESVLIFLFPRKNFYWISFFYRFIGLERSLLVAVIEWFAWTSRENVELRAVRVVEAGTDLRIVEHSIPVLLQKRHIHTETLRGTASSVAQNLLRLNEIRYSQKSSGYKVSCCKYINYSKTIGQKQHSYVLLMYSEKLH